MTPEQKLPALFAAEAAPARDYGFQAEVVARIARRRAWATVLSLVPGLVAATALLWGLQAVFGGVLGQLGPVLVPVAMILTLVGVSLGAAFWLTRWLARA